MLARALIVLLLVLNLGVASWWALRPSPAPIPAATSVPAGVVRLQLVAEVPAAARPRAPSVPAAAPPPAPAAAVPALAERCFAFGPFADAAALEAARAKLQPRVLRLQVRAAPATKRGWRVWLPPLADRAAAEAMATRITAAGFHDYYLVPDGAERNAIALGRFGNEDAARRRQQALNDAGFAAQAEALAGDAATVQWLDVAAAAGFDAEAARAAIGASQARGTRCAAPR